MDEIFNYSKVIELLSNYYNYNDGDFLSKIINELNIAKDDSIVYPKNLRLENKKLELYIFNADVIYKVYKKDEDNVEFKIINKREINNIKFSLGYDDDDDVCLSFCVGNDIESFSLDDISRKYRLKTKNTLKAIIQYFIN